MLIHIQMISGGCSHEISLPLVFIDYLRDNSRVSKDA